VQLLTWIAAGGGTSDPVTRDGAQAAARNEVAKRAYHRHDPSLAARALSWLWDRLGRLLAAGTRHSPGHAVGALLVMAIVAAVIVLILARVGALRRTPRAGEAIFSTEETTADDHRKLARRFAADGQWAEAIREHLRAIARELEERGVIDPTPGRTAAELSREATRELPGLERDLSRATSTFESVWYGGRTATSDDERLLRDLDDAVAGSHRSLAVAK
jgi:Domain of unknown function (DUF4129)